MSEKLSEQVAGLEGTCEALHGIYRDAVGSLLEDFGDDGKIAKDVIIKDGLAYMLVGVSGYVSGLLSLLKELEGKGKNSRGSICCPMCEGILVVGRGIKHSPNCTLARALKGVEG